MEFHGMVLAAGLSSRMGAFKPLLKLKEKTMLEYSVDSMLQAGVSQVIVVLGHRADELEGLLRAHYDPALLTFIRNQHYAESDMLTSVKIGISALPICEAFYLLPGDMPAIHKSTFLDLKKGMEKTKAMVAFPTIGGQRKHPPLISWKFIKNILDFKCEGGLREVWKQFENDVITVPVEDRGCMLDVDTQADYNRLIDYMANSSLS
jgi:molybdenum cofactor cytidylyltransferase